jgi:hypothetical protein
MGDHAIWAHTSAGRILIQIGCVLVFSALIGRITFAHCRACFFVLFQNENKKAASP